MANNLVQEDKWKTGGSTVTTRHAYDGANVWLDADGSNVGQTRYLLGEGMDQLLARTVLSGANAGLWAYLTDRLGSMRDEVQASSGSVMTHVDYAGFGSVLTIGGSWYGDVGRWTGRAQDSDTGLQGDRDRWLQLSTGKWLSDDRIGFTGGDLNVSRYVGNNATNATDPTGLQKEIPRWQERREMEAAKAAEPAMMAAERAKFIAWYDEEKKPENMKWLKSVPIPPDTLQFTPTVLVSRFSSRPSWESGDKTVDVPNGWTKDSNFMMNVMGYHPNAVFGIRKRSKNGDYGAQAMYDRKGKIITDGLSAGTADKISLTVSITGHRNADVIPFDLAWKLDKYYGGDTYRKKYREVRPPNVSKFAPKNVVE